MTGKPILRAVPAPPEEDDKCRLCACRGGKCIDNNYVPQTPICCFRNGESLYFKEVVREPVRN